MKRGVVSLLMAGLLALAIGIGVTTSDRAEASPGSASNLYVSNISSTQASFNWNSSGWGYVQWVDISHWNGYYWQWENAGPLGAWDGSYTWSNLLPNTTYYVRVNTGLWNGDWQPTDWVRFDTPGYSAPTCYQPGNYGGYAQPYVVPNVINCQPPQGGGNVNVWIDRGEGSRYNVGDTIRVCYSVSQPMYVQLIDYMSNGQQNNLRSGYDDGRGDCLNAQVTPPKGREHITIYGQGGSSDTVNFRVR